MRLLYSPAWMMGVRVARAQRASSAVAERSPRAHAEGSNAVARFVAADLSSDEQDDTDDEEIEPDFLPSEADPCWREDFGTGFDDDEEPEPDPGDFWTEEDDHEWCSAALALALRALQVGESQAWRLSTRSSKAPLRVVAGGAQAVFLPLDPVSRSLVPA